MRLVALLHDACQAPPSGCAAARSRFTHRDPARSTKPRRRFRRELHCAGAVSSLVVPGDVAGRGVHNAGPPRLSSRVHFARPPHEPRRRSQQGLARARGARGHGRSPSGQRLAELHTGRPRRDRSEGVARARPRRLADERARVSAQQARDGQPRAGRPAEGIGPLRPADRPRHPRRRRTDRRRAAGRVRVRRRAFARRRAARGARGATASIRRISPRRSSTGASCRRSDDAAVGADAQPQSSVVRARSASALPSALRCAQSRI